MNSASSMVRFWAGSLSASSESCKNLLGGRQGRSKRKSKRPKAYEREIQVHCAEDHAEELLIEQLRAGFAFVLRNSRYSVS